MKPILFILLSLCLSATVVHSQTQYLSAGDSDQEAIDLLTKASKQFTSNNAKVTFMLKISYPGEPSMVSEGVLFQSGASYHLDLKEYAIFSDGTTRWIYLKGPNEINIYNESNGQDWISPQDFLTLHNSDELVLSLIGEKNDGVSVIEAKPLEGRFDHYSKFSIGIKENQLKYIHALSADGSRQEMSITKIEHPASLDVQKLFTFNKASYPGVYVEDLRLD
jgi:hypothetical protein